MSRWQQADYDDWDEDETLIANPVCQLDVRAIEEDQTAALGVTELAHAQEGDHLCRSAQV